MKRHSDNYFIHKTPVLQALNNNIFTYNNTNYLFDCWYYQQNTLVFMFRNTQLTTNERLTIQLYSQHINNYANTLQLIFENFDKIVDKYHQI